MSSTGKTAKHQATTYSQVRVKCSNNSNASIATTVTIVATTIIKQKGRGAGLGMGLDVEKCTGSCFRLSVASARAYLCRSFCNEVPEYFSKLTAE